MNTSHFPSPVPRQSDPRDRREGRSVASFGLGLFSALVSWIGWPGPAAAQARPPIPALTRELDARKVAGLAVQDLEIRYRRASGDIDAATRRLDTGAGEALQRTQPARRDLRGTVDRLRHRSAGRAELGDWIQGESARSGELLKANERAGREGLSAAPVRRPLDEAPQLIGQATQAVRTDPDRAEMLVSQVERRPREDLNQAERPPDLRRQADQKAKAVMALEQATAAELDRARRSGAPLDDIEEDWERAREQTAAARADAGTDDRKALDAWTSAEAIMTRVRDEARARLDRQRTDTLNVPLVSLEALGLLGLAALGVLYYRKRLLQGTVDEQFRGFREKAVGLMDQLDALRQRHKELPTTDPDFTAPPSGATLALYNEVETELNSLWDRWLKVMEVWDETQKLVRARSGLAVKQTEEARRLLEEGDIDELLRRCNSCKERLDRLNQGHERARSDLKAGRDEVAALRKSLVKAARAGLPTDPYQEEVATVEAMLTEAEGLIEADPIGAEEVIVRSRQALAAVVARSGRVLTRPGETRSAAAAIDEVAAAVAKLRWAAAKLQSNTLMGRFVGASMVVGGLALLFGFLTALMPLAVLVLGFVFTLAVLWVTWRMVASWFGLF